MKLGIHTARHLVLWRSGREVPSPGTTPPTPRSGGTGAGAAEAAEAAAAAAAGQKIIRLELVRQD